MMGVPAPTLNRRVDHQESHGQRVITALEGERAAWAALGLRRQQSARPFPEVRSFGAVPRIRRIMTAQLPGKGQPLEG